MKTNLTSEKNFFHRFMFLLTAKLANISAVVKGCCLKTSLKDVLTLFYIYQEIKKLLTTAQCCAIL